MAARAWSGQARPWRRRLAMAPSPGFLRQPGRHCRRSVIVAAHDGFALHRGRHDRLRKKKKKEEERERKEQQKVNKGKANCGATHLASLHARRCSHKPRSTSQKERIHPNSIDFIFFFLWCLVFGGKSATGVHRPEHRTRVTSLSAGGRAGPTRLSWCRCRGGGGGSRGGDVGDGVIVAIGCKRQVNSDRRRAIGGR